VAPRRLAIAGPDDCDRDLPAPRSNARTGYRVHVWCKSCRDARDVDFAAGKGDVPLVQMKCRCGTCGSRLTEFIPHEAKQRLVIIGAAGQSTAPAAGLPSVGHHWRDLVVRRRRSVGRRPNGDTTMRRDELRHHSFHVFGADMQPHTTPAPIFGMLLMDSFLSGWGEVIDWDYMHDRRLWAWCDEARRFGRSLQHGRVPGENAELVQAPRQCGSFSRNR
jgi:hypothetical protein